MLRRSYSNVLTAHGLAIADDGRVLMGLRSSGGSRPGMWELPGGKMEPEDGADLKAAVRREWLEELGVDIVVGDLVKSVEMKVEVDLRMYLYEVAISRGVPRCIVHDGLIWVSLEEAIVHYPCAPATYLYYRSALAVVDRVVEVAGSGHGSRRGRRR